MAHARIILLVIAIERRIRASRTGYMKFFPSRVQPQLERCVHGVWMSGKGTGVLANRSAYGLKSSYVVPIGAAVMLFGAAGISPPRPRVQVASPDIVDRSATCLSPCVPAPEGLIAWWPFDEDTSGQNFNELIHDNDGIPVGNVMPVGGHVGNAAGFGFGFSAIKAAHIDPLDFNVDEDFSLAAWLYVPDGVDIVPMIDKRTSEGVDELGWTFGSSSGTLLLRSD